MSLTTKQVFPWLLALVVLVIAIWSSIEPVSRAVWYAEVLPIFLVFLALVVSYSRFQFSNLAYFLMSLWMVLHLIGAHYTFEQVPFEWANRLLAPWLGEGRNHFDRVAHYVIGFYSFPMAEWLFTTSIMWSDLSGLFCPIFYYEYCGGL